jgi:hypothetical protein
MPSSLTWIDHDRAARERSLRILSLFQERESRDELGLGGIRDSISEQLFPGTSTIQTRLRYMLFVPWIYQSLEQKKVLPPKFAIRAGTAERDLIETLKNADVQEKGILGGRTGRSLKRLPSSVYWSGLGSWGIRIADVSQDQYHRHIGMYYRKREDAEAEKRRRRETLDDIDIESDRRTLTWHPRLPKPPENFPKVANFNLTKEEADFILDCIRRRHPQSLLAHLVLQCSPAEVSMPWEHPDYATFNNEHIELLTHARLFSEVMHGAALLYNIGLAELVGLENIDHYRDLFDKWNSQIYRNEIADWSLERFWALTVGRGYTISPATKRFVEAWRALVVSSPTIRRNPKAALSLVREREIFLKQARSRFQNASARDQWRGGSGMVLINYRWHRVSRLLKDLYAGLHPDEAVDAQSEL